MGAFSFLFSVAQPTNSEIPEIFPLALRASEFTKSNIVSTYLKILTDTMERTHGLPTALQPLLWDNCLANESSEGLISLLAKAMSDKADLFLVYATSVKVLRKATSEEQRQIEADYKKSGESSVGVFISFKNYRRTEMLEIYSALEYCVLSSLNKSLNVAKAVQVKIKDLRGSVSLTDSSKAVDQARSIAEALRKGNDVLIDVGDTIETAKVDTAPTEKAIGFLDSKKAFVLGLPMSYLSGEQTGGIGATGEADMRAVERGLKLYWISILRPTIKALFGNETEFKSQDFRQITSGLEALKAFDLVSDDILSKDAKQKLVVRMFDLDAAAEEKAKLAEEKERAKNPPEPKPNLGSGAFGR